MYQQKFVDKCSTCLLPLSMRFIIISWGKTHQPRGFREWNFDILRHDFDLEYRCDLFGIRKLVRWDSSQLGNRHGDYCWKVLRKENQEEKSTLSWRLWKSKVSFKRGTTSQSAPCQMRFCTPVRCRLSWLRGSAVLSASVVYLISALWLARVSTFDVHGDLPWL